MCYPMQYKEYCISPDYRDCDTWSLPAGSLSHTHHSLAGAHQNAQIIIIFRIVVNDSRHKLLTSVTLIETELSSVHQCISSCQQIVFKGNLKQIIVHNV